VKKFHLCGLVVLSLILFLAGCSDGPTGSANQSITGSGSDIGQIDDARINNAESEPGNWLAYGRDYEEQRFSPLTQINRETVDRLGLAFELDLGGNDALEATPIVVDNTMFFTSTFSVVHAVDAKTGVEKWRYDPMVPKDYLRRACCGPINRGVAVYQGKVYVGTLDGRLVAINAGSGEKVWEVNTIIDTERNYSITGAPKAARVKFISVMAVQSSACAVTSPLTIPRQAMKSGDSLRSLAIPLNPSSTPKWNSRPRPGRVASGGRSVEAVRSGTPSSTIQNLITSTWVSETARPGPASFALLAEAIIYS